MIQYPHIDPVAVSFGPLKIHWYGIMYLVGFAAAWWLGRYRARKPGSGWTEEQVSDIVFYAALGVVLGGRIGYILFYDFSAFANDLSRIFRVWEGGMSFHGGLLGVLLALWLFGKKYKKGFFPVTDFIAPLVPLGLGAGRVGNFINSELWGKPGDVPWAMVIHELGPALHPSQLYEAFLEGLVLFIILWLYSSKPRPVMAVSGMFLLFYGIFRFGVEFVRVPDAQLGYLALDWVTMGQILSAPMVIVGAVMIAWAYKNNKVINVRG
jgi:phosphatidylglycerol:prolipoprotein diacylglycerol transferase